MTKRRIRALREEWRHTHGGEAPGETRGEWGIGRLWRKLAGKEREQEVGVRTGYARSRRRRMKRQHVHPAPEGRRLERLRAVAVSAFRPKRRRGSGRERRSRRRQRVSEYISWKPPLLAVRMEHDPSWPAGRTAEDGSVY